MEEKLERISQKLETLIKIVQGTNNLHAEPLGEEEWNGKTYQKYSVLELRDMGVSPELRRHLADPPAATNYSVRMLYTTGECLLGLYGDGHGNEFETSGRSLREHLETKELTKQCMVLIDPEWVGQ